MPRATVYLGESSGQALVKGTWKYARGYVPGQPNEGLVEQAKGSPARLADYDDSGWETCHDLTERMSHGFSFMWYRINVTFPKAVDGHPVKGVRAGPGPVFSCRSLRFAHPAPSEGGMTAWDFSRRTGRYTRLT